MRAIAEQEGKRESIWMTPRQAAAYSVSAWTPSTTRAPPAGSST
jgi:hypothetical protein